MWRQIPRKIGGLSKLSKRIIRNEGTTPPSTPPPRAGRGGGLKDKKIFQGASERFKREIEQAKFEVVKEEKTAEIQERRKIAYEKATKEGASEADRVEYIAIAKSLDKQITSDLIERSKTERKKMKKSQSRLPIKKDRDDGLEGLSSTELYTRLYGKAPKNSRKFVDYDPEEEKALKEKQEKKSSAKFSEEMQKKMDELDSVEQDEAVVQELENKVFADQLEDKQFAENFEKQEAARFSKMTFTPEQELEFGGEENAFMHQEQSHLEYEEISHFIDESGADTESKKKKKSKFSLDEDSDEETLSDEDELENDRYEFENNVDENAMDMTATDTAEFDEDGNPTGISDPTELGDVPNITSVVRNLQRLKKATDGMGEFDGLNPIELFHISQKTPFGYHKYLEHNDSFEANVVGGLPLVLHNEMREPMKSDIELMKLDCQVFVRHADGSIKDSIRHQRRTRLAKKLKKQNRPPQEPSHLSLHLPQDPFLTVPLREKPKDPEQRRILEQAFRNTVRNPSIFRPFRFQLMKDLEREFQSGESNDETEGLIRLHKVDMRISFPGKPKPNR